MSDQFRPPLAQRTGSCVSPRVSLDAFEEILLPRQEWNFDLSVVHPGSWLQKSHSYRIFTSL